MKYSRSSEAKFFRGENAAKYNFIHYFSNICILQTVLKMLIFMTDRAKWTRLVDRRNQLWSTGHQDLAVLRAKGIKN